VPQGNGSLSLAQLQFAGAAPSTELRGDLEILTAYRLTLAGWRTTSRLIHNTRGAVLKAMHTSDVNSFCSGFGNGRDFTIQGRIDHLFH
jgi:hypothetical protein